MEVGGSRVGEFPSLGWESSVSAMVKTYTETRGKALSELSKLWIAKPKSDA